MERITFEKIADSSPEATGDFNCRCGNETAFVGVDDRGTPGECDECGERQCVCVDHVILNQSFTVENGEITGYESHDGGYGADIGEYTRIYCEACGEILWVDVEIPEAVAAVTLEAIGGRGRPSDEDVSEWLRGVLTCCPEALPEIVQRGYQGQVPLTPKEAAPLLAHESRRVRQWAITMLGAEPRTRDRPAAPRRGHGRA